MSESFMKRGISGKKYDYFSKDILRIVNLHQVDFFMQEYGLVPIDVVLSDDRKHPDKKIVLFIFEKTEKCQEAYATWRDREHDN